jgi:hypothetical protein
MLPPRLQQRITHFLTTVRVGVDFGEHAGGIAVVKGNEVLHAETFLDFHEATLEQRRILRRGRRTRHAKRMRLARLRSWVLRQKLPNGEPLPDPYRVMRDPKFMVQPGLYRQQGCNPQATPSWVQLTREGKADAEGFVRALTLIFQKRGFKWDAIALEEMNDAKLKEFLQSARIPTGDPSFADQVRAQIARRRTDPENPRWGIKSKRVGPEELEALFQVACRRGNEPPRPRMAEHRSVKEAELRGVVEGFEQAVGLPNQISDRWKRELCGLLNKVLRPARFENRLKTGCAWCGKATPRKAKVREIAYRAAIHNLRVREGFGERKLTDSEREAYLKWWADPANAPGVDAISKRLKKMNPQQEKMARQIHDLLKNQDPKGRASLCKAHLQMAADGKTMKDAGVEWQTISVRKAPNPCRERRDERVMRRLEQILFQPGQKGPGAWRHGPVSFITLEVPEPDTERVGKGQQTQRQEETLKERLVDESGGCIYRVIGECAGETEKEHIFPRSREGPSVRMNLVATCNKHNKEKDNRTPYEWLAGDAGNSERWKAFASHVVNALKLPERKKKILLNDEPNYPEGDPTPFARVGARPRQFVVELGKVFARRGVPVPQVAYKVGEPLVQRVRGSETHFFRFSWCKKADGSQNFPYPKNRSTLFSHAEDAAILAGMPPHTWREHAKCHTAERPNFRGEMKARPDLVVPELAPDWASFLQARHKPFVRILGRYPVNWKSAFADQTFWRDPEDLQATKIRRSKLVRDLTQKDLPKIASSQAKAKVQPIVEGAGLGPKGTIAEAVASQMAGPQAKKAAIPQAIERLEADHPELRRVQVSSQKGGTLAQIAPDDGPMRKVQIKPATDGAIVWQRMEGKKKKALRTHISLLRPRPLQRFGFPRVHPAIPPDATILGQFQRHQILWLHGEPDRPEGFYRVTKLQENGITVAPEEAVPLEILRRLKQRGTEVEGAGEDVRDTILLGKEELRRYFERKGEKRGRRAATSTSA